jgi:ABC-2 type transport system permease protein
VILNVLKFELRLNRLTILLVSASLMLFQFVLIFFFKAARLDESMPNLFELIPKPIRALMGSSYVDLLTVKGFLSFGFTHPLSLLLICTGAIVMTSRSATGGAEGGITDLLLSQPISRSFLLLSRAAAAEAGGLCMIFCMWLGHLAGVTCIDLPADPPRMPYFLIAVNAYAFYLAVQGMGLLAAACSRHRASAVGLSIAVLAAMLFLRIAAQIWNAFEPLARLSFLTYFVPGKTVMSQAFPWSDVLVLLLFYLLTVAAALVVYNRRDI